MRTQKIKQGWCYQSMSTSIEELMMRTNFAFVIKISHWEGIFVDDNGTKCTSLEILSAK